MEQDKDKDEIEQSTAESPEAAEFEDAPEVEEASAKKEAAEEHAHPKMDAAKDKAKELADEAKDKAKVLADEARDKFREISQSPGFQSISVFTWVGAAIAVLFLIAMGIDAFNLRWWIMLPLGAAGHIVLAKEWMTIGDRKSMNARICAGAFIAIALMLVYRDARLSEALLSLVEMAADL